MNSRYNTNLSCITVDNLTYAYNQNCSQTSELGWCKDEWTGYNENSNDECILGITELKNIEVNIYPNPVKNILYVNYESPIDQIKIYTLHGQSLYETRKTQIDVSLLSPGLYLASILIDGKKIVKKFIKN